MLEALSSWWPTIAIVIVVFFIIAIYNKLVNFRNQVKNAFAQIEVQLERRFDLIPNLVESAKGYMKHEQSTLQGVIEARNEAAAILKSIKAQSGGQFDIASLQQAEGVLDGMLSKLFAVSESYPELKADTHISQLMEEISSTENRVGYARQAYNDAVMKYNNEREVFPNNFIANIFNFQEEKSYKVSSAQVRKAVKVSFE